MQKNKITVLCAVCICLFGTTACTEPLELDKGEKLLTLQISADTLWLAQRANNDEALAFTWTSGTNKGTGAAISYLFEMDIRGNNFADGIKINLGKTSSRILSFTHKELNDTLLQIWPNMPLEQLTELEARMTATIADSTVTTQVSSIIAFAIAPYKYRNLNLYLIGSATPNGWNNQQAIAMTILENEVGGFEWEGTLVTGELKFIVQLGEWLPCYVRNEVNSTKMCYRTADDVPDYKWNIAQGGTYHIYVNTESLDIQIKPLNLDMYYSQLWMIGSATPGGWSWDAVTPLTRNIDKKNIFTYDGPLYVGELKFPVELKTDWSGQFIMALQADATPLAESTYLICSQPDNKWKITEAGNYAITIDLQAEKIYFTKQ